MEYNKNDPMQGFNEWAQYIHREVVKMGHNGQVVLRHFDVELANKLKEMSRLTAEAKEIINR